MAQTFPLAHRVLSLDVGRKNLALCLLGTDLGIEGWRVTECEPSAAGMAACLADVPWALDATRVVIERQPPRNPTMCRLQHYLEMYFAMHGKAVAVQDPKHKLAWAASTRWWPSTVPDGWTYRARKKLAVQTTAAFLEETSGDAVVETAPGAARPSGARDAREIFGSSKKKDDLADSFLQAMAYVHNVLPLETARAEARARKKPAGGGGSGAAAGGGAESGDPAPARPKARKPTPKQMDSGRFCEAHVLWFARGCRTRDEVEAVLAATPCLARRATALFGSTDALCAALGVAPGAA